MSDFGKRRGESILLFAEKEFKPEGQGRGRGGGRMIIICFCKARGGEHHFFDANEAIERQQVGWRGAFCGGGACNYCYFGLIITNRGRFIGVISGK